MNDFLFARSQMAMSLAFHIIFAALGIGMPLLMAIAEGMYLRTEQSVYLNLCERWAKGTAILFAVGAVSGTVLSFELGLLWPRFMERAGAVIGMPFSLEGFAFFTEAIFLGVYLYGWKRVSPLVHWLSGMLVALSGIFSGIFVVTANAWMNSPAGFKIVDGKITDVDPIAAMLNRASFHEVLHMTLAAFVATGFLVAVVAAQTGLRASELLGLRSQDVVLGTGAHIRCTGKGRKERCTPLRKDAAVALRAWIKERNAQPSDPLFPNARGQRLSHDGLDYILAKHVAIAKKECPSLAKKRVTPHVLRHSLAMDLLQHGIDRSIIALWLGHESVETTQIYLHANLQIKEQALAKTNEFKRGLVRYRPKDQLLAFLQGL